MTNLGHAHPASTPEPVAAQLAFRSGAVARMARMPVSTLRIWEQRYQAVRPGTAPSGHRLYSAADVERVVLLRRLTAQGHAIGSLAPLDMRQLQQLAFTQAAGLAQERRAEPPKRRAPLRVVVVGPAMAQRLQRLAAAHPGAQPLQVVGEFSSLADARQATGGPAAVPVDLLLWQSPSLQVGALPELKAAQEACGARHVAVCYRFAGAAAREALAGIGAAVVREPADNEALGTWLASLPLAMADLPADDHGSVASSGDTGAWMLGVLGLANGAVPARRFDDASLTEFAGLSSTIACECPSHLAELLMQISAFETYSAACAHRSPADARLHAYLQRVAGAARVLFETALEQVAAAEGLALPQSPRKVARP